MLWEVTGTDQTTGEPVTLTIDAETADSAQRRAARRGLVVGDAFHVDPEPTAPDVVDPIPEPVAYAAPPLPTATARRRGPVPDYGAIVTGARVLNAVALLNGLVGGLAAAVGLLVVLLAVVGGKSAAGRPGVVVGATIDSAAGLVLLAVGVLLLAVGAVVRMVAVVGLAVRDIARNSF